LLDAVKSGELATADALEKLSKLPFTDLPNARVDTHRALRHGIPEVVYAPGKTPERIVEIVRAPFSLVTERGFGSEPGISLLQ
jgi:NCAIR mutase (PurE)-related protein